ncbi:hypothetical protein TNCV_3129671 [Trichonephila clavipes]|nr:hypothetical protein TNCV_3129671 [Trichonephila clavipes]
MWESKSLRSSHTYLRKIDHELLKEHLRRRSECDTHIDSGLKKYLIYKAPFKTKNQEKHYQELGKEGIAISGQEVKKRSLKVCNVLYEKSTPLERILVNFFSRSTGIVVSGADFGAVGTGFETRRRHGCLPLRHGGILNSHRAANPLVWLVEGEER